MIIITIIEVWIKGDDDEFPHRGKKQFEEIYIKVQEKEKM